MDSELTGTQLMELLKECRLCPRACGADRLAGERGFCGMGARAAVARAALHPWEEPCLNGGAGAGAVFFSGCSLGCVYCQNAQIALRRHTAATAQEALEEPVRAGEDRTGSGAALPGKEVDPEQLARIFLNLQNQGAGTLDLVTAAHFLPQTILALRLAKEQGLIIPVVYNSSGYEEAGMLRHLEGLVDIYMPDFKYMDPETAGRWSGAPDYPERAKEALTEMVRQVPECVYDEEGQMRRGVLVRHMLLPGHVREGCSIVTWLYENFGGRIALSLLSQYTPMPQAAGDALLCRKVTKREYEKLVRHALDLGITQGYVQEGEAAKESFIPAWNGEGVDV